MLLLLRGICTKSSEILSEKRVQSVLQGAQLLLRAPAHPSGLCAVSLQLTRWCTRWHLACSAGMRLLTDVGIGLGAGALPLSSFFWQEEWGGLWSLKGLSWMFKCWKVDVRCLMGLLLTQSSSLSWNSGSWFRQVYNTSLLLVCAHYQDACFLFFFSFLSLGGIWFDSPFFTENLLILLWTHPMVL